MKNFISSALCALIFCCCNASAQGTIIFRTNLDGLKALPANESGRGANGVFELAPDLLFWGNMTTGGFVYQSVSIFRSTDPNELGAPVFDLTRPRRETRIPPPQDYDALIRPLTEAEAQDLQSGYWWVVAFSPGFPNGEIRGQILAEVPEPTTFAFLVAGFALMFRFRRAGRETNGL